MITGSHVIVYTSNADGLRTFLRDTLELPSVDAGRGWLVFALPPTEVGVHPTEGEERHELWLMCDDIEATVEELKGRGVEFLGSVDDQGYGLVATIQVPGGGEICLYQPRHPTAH